MRKAGNQSILSTVNKSQKGYNLWTFKSRYVFSHQKEIISETKSYSIILKMQLEDPDYPCLVPTSYQLHDLEQVNPTESLQSF